MATNLQFRNRAILKIPHLLFACLAMTFSALCCAGVPHHQDARTEPSPRVLLVGDSYMVAMEPYFKNVWPGVSSLAKVGVAPENAMFSSLATQAESFDYVIISLGINDIWSVHTNQAWRDQYASMITGFINRFPARLRVNWILPPCPVGTSITVPNFERWKSLVLAIEAGAARANRPVRVVLPPADVCGYKAKDGLHYQAPGYTKIVLSVLTPTHLASN